MAQPEVRDEARASRAMDEALESTEIVVAGAPEASEVRPSVRLRSFEPGEVVAERYRLDRKIGEGGMGVVWAATHTVSQRKVALKFLKSENEDRARRLLREARISGHLSHPNIVEVLDAFSAKGATVLVMELLDGETVEAHLARKGVLTEAEAITLLTPVLDALSSAHRAGIVHRDLKPANIFLAGPEARVKVLDFGIAKMGRGEDLSASASLTQTGSLVGTPHYMAPEQVFGDPDVDARADVWALGVILFECVSGQRPFDAESFGQIIKQVTMGSPRPLPASVSPELRALVERMLSRDRAERPRDAAEVRLALAFPTATNE
ncbi:MAG: serine/threonine protein kinase, partial [Polyangiaceae bacterium]|nr:serine/threonine protein kinase [Polyangiaceae bacterium]